MIQNSISIAVKGEIVDGGSPPLSNWILATGFWRDTGVWDDTAFWID